MTFVTAALAMAGLAAMAIPILIHLLWRQRRRPVQWAAMQFLLEALKKHRRRLRFEQLLLLAVRCLILAVLGFALARPVLKAAGIDLGGARTVYLVIDNGLASSAIHADGTTALEHQVQAARNIMTSLSPGDFVGVISSATPPQPLLVPPSSDLKSAAELLTSLEPSESATDIGGALTLLHDALADSDAAHDRTLVYLLSEFREGSAPIGHSLPSALAEHESAVTYLAPMPDQEPIGNVQIVSIDPTRSVLLPGAADGSGQIKVQLERSGDQLPEQVTTVRMTGEDISRVEPIVVHWKPGDAHAEVDFALDVAAHGEREVALTVSIDADHMPADDRHYIVLQSRSHIRVLLIDRRNFGFQPTVDRLTAGQWLHRALEPVDASPLQVVDVDPVALDVSDLKTTDVAVCPRPDLLDDDGWALLHAFIDEGGLLIVCPPGGVQVHRWVTSFTEQLHLPWRIFPEVAEHTPALRAAESSSGGALLRMISGELPQLLQPVLVDRTLPLDEVASRGQRAITLNDGSSLLITASPTQRLGADQADTSGPAAPSRGMVAYLPLALDLEWSNLPSKPLMVPLLHETIRQGLSVIRSARQAMVGVSSTLDLPRPAARIVDVDGTFVLTGENGRLLRPLQRSGLWQVQDAAGLKLGTAAVNIDAHAGRTATQAEHSVSAWLSETGEWTFLAPDALSAELASVEAGSPISYALLIALICLVVIETLLARWFSHALRGTALPKMRVVPDRFAMGGIR